MRFILKKLGWILPLMLVLWTAGLVHFVYKASSVLPIPETEVDAIIVLTGGSGRIEKALDLFANRKADDVFVSGVHESVNTLDIRRRSPRLLPECCISLGYEATTTIENAAEIQKWLRGADYKSIILVTSNYHMPRALLELEALEKHGINIHPISVKPKRSDHNKRHFFKLIIGEYHKTLYRTMQLSLMGR